MNPTYQLLAELAKVGILGVLLALSLIWHWKREKDMRALQLLLKEVQDKRTEDSKEVVDKVLQISSSLGENVQKMVAVIESVDRQMDRINDHILNQSGAFRVLPPKET